MASSEIIQSCKQLDSKEELLINLNAGLSKMILTLGNLTKIKNKLTQIPNLIPNTFCSSLFEITIEPTFPFQDFAHWIAKDYVKSNSQVLSSDGSSIICTLNPDSIRRLLGLPLPSTEKPVIQVSELSSLSTIKSLTIEELTSFMAKLLKLEVNQDHATFPYDISFFSEPVQAIFSLMS